MTCPGKILTAFLLACTFLLAGTDRSLPGAQASSRSSVDLRTLVLSTGPSGIPVPIPRTREFAGSRKMVFHFLGSPKFFVGIIVQSFDASGRLLHHGLFDQGPIDEVLSRHLFHRDERIQILGIFRDDGHYLLRLKRFRTGKTLDLSLDLALATLTAHIGAQPDLVWAAR